MSERFDIIVAGSGAAGIAAAVSAARAGARTLLFDKNSSVGGTGGLSGLTTLCGLYDDAGNFLNDGFSREFAEAISETAPVKMGKLWVSPYRPEKFCAVAESFFSKEPNLQTRWNSSIENVVVKNDKILSVNGFETRAVIDCSGTAEIAQKTGLETLATDERTQASSVVFTLEKVWRNLQTPADAAQILLPLARAGFPTANFQPNPKPNSVTVKFSGTPEQAPALVEFLQKNVHGFENCSAPTKYFSIARRAGRMIVGEYLLTGADVLAAKKFSDAAARCSWPVEQWNEKGAVRFRYLPSGEHYEIPARALRAAKIKNLFMAGKTISADVDAIASARVMGCCLATGAAAGKMAAETLKM
ncbi:MAG TPA: FAD-dependent oxidoreductase [Verrucomicrobiae bacterium]|nr:FAD-dependent oxidoreductase [Verrucomicrobiae bacterium]